MEEEDEKESRTKTPGSEEYHGLELQVLVEVRHCDHHEGAIDVLEADRQHGGEEALRKVMQHLPLATKLCRQSRASQPNLQNPTAFP